MATLEIPTTKRPISFLETKKRIQKTKTVWDVLQNLGLTKLWNNSSDTSITHDTILYK